MLISDWISDLCSSDLLIKMDVVDPPYMAPYNTPANIIKADTGPTDTVTGNSNAIVNAGPMPGRMPIAVPNIDPIRAHIRLMGVSATSKPCRSEEHTSELQSLMRISYAVFCLKKKSKPNNKPLN